MQRSLFSSYYTTEAEGESAYDDSYFDDIIVVDDEKDEHAEVVADKRCEKNNNGRV